MKRFKHSTGTGHFGRGPRALTGQPIRQLGTSDGLNRVGTDLPLASGATINGPANPPSVYWQDTPLVLTPEGEAFAAGQLVLDIFFFSLPIPAL
jgi:hypothetical protein